VCLDEVHTEFPPWWLFQQPPGLFSCTKVSIQNSTVASISRKRLAQYESLQVGARSCRESGDHACWLEQASDSASRYNDLPAPPPGGFPDRVINMLGNVPTNRITGLGVPSLTQKSFHGGTACVTSFTTIGTGNGKHQVSLTGLRPTLFRDLTLKRRGTVPWSS
jgi:hypothetical protein